MRIRVFPVHTFPTRVHKTKEAFRIRLACKLTLGLFLFFLVANSAGAQTNEKMIIRRLSIVKYPLDLSIEYNGKPLNGDWKVLEEKGLRTQTFAGDADWLKHLSLKLKNVSDQPINWVEVHLIFPEAVDTKTTSDGLNLPSPTPTPPRRAATALHRIEFGVGPYGNNQAAKLRLLPGEIIEIPLASEYSQISKLVQPKDFSVEQLNQILIDIQSALFEDGTMFMAGMMYRRDPKDTKRWIPIGSAPIDRRPNQ